MKSKCVLEMFSLEFKFLDTLTILLKVVSSVELDSMYGSCILVDSYLNQRALFDMTFLRAILVMQTNRLGTMKEYASIVLQ